MNEIRGAVLEKKLRKFYEKHGKCKTKDRDIVYYKLFPTPIGVGVHIVCPKCNKEKDITDYGKW